MDKLREQKNSNAILVCPVCGKVDATQEHIDDCGDYDREQREDNRWK
jgi:hypothetical protein